VTNSGKNDHLVIWCIAAFVVNYPFTVQIISQS